MSDINTTLINSVKKIGINIAKYTTSFLVGFERVAKSVKKSQFTEYPDQLGKQVQQDANDFSLSSNNISESNGGKPPIIVNVLSSLAEMSVEPAHQRRQRL
ncbi:hypothetical protein J3Q64DRAFT_1701035 [Phycomyces blakesleeanus]|uniref:Uncharacterized protein n=2 Tax=Phycomyces blakesleeanus TaxID=4837 RepID=A0A167JKL7_PHYB8|nr:hypothetical protein PHYBLDRAFT_175490 [Phycomyces blakesleeanus NRRL 1555(-)]OAD66196.1 hypothetical protein PHYBLDRAFT_175490 [Phycomyces blakesleeanus NRRL 1555(-)]|eukprot:XP_018284236.1 hypothetical protein PHYBLDRAFT_175490 [Phycomyces blakesleeanus NRRL 1555(-)]